MAERVRREEAGQTAEGSQVPEPGGWGAGLPRLAVFSGHSGGHLFPAVAFSRAFKNRHPSSRIDLITSRRAETFLAKVPAGVFDRVHFVQDFPFPSGISLNLLPFLLKLPQAFMEAWQCLKSIDPDVSVGFGSYVAYPGIVLSSFRKIPTLIHEQNLVPGKATRWLVRHASLVAVTFGPTFGTLGLKKRFVTGLPIRFRAADVPNRGSGASLEPDRGEKPFRILIVGGSQGAQGLNRLVFDAFCRLTDEEKRKVAVNHIAGAKDFEWVSESYEKIGIRHQVYPFFDKMNELYGAADMAVTRAGAGTLFELALFGLPAVVVPYPHAGNHQTANAKYFESAGAILLRDEKDVDADWLGGKIRLLMGDAGFRKELSKKISRFAGTDADERLVGLAETLIASKRQR